MAAMVDALERRNIRCHVMSVELCDSSHGGNKQFIHSIKIKDPGEPLSIDRLAGTVAETWWLRRILFRLLEEDELLYNENKSGYGRCIRDDNKERLMVAANLGCDPWDIYIPETIDNFNTDEKAINFVINQLNLHIGLFKKHGTGLGHEMREA